MMSGNVRAALIVFGITAMTLTLLWLAPDRRPAPPAPPAVLGGSIPPPERGADTSAPLTVASTADPVVPAAAPDNASPTVEAAEQPDSADETPPAAAPKQATPQRLPLSLEGRLLWDDSVDHRDFAVTCRRGDGKEFPINIGQDGRFRRFDMRPGPVDLLVHMQGDDVSLTTLFDVVIPTAAPCTDPRLQAIDVTDVKRIELTFLSPQGTPIQSTLHALLLRPDGEKGRHITGWGMDGVLSVLRRGAGVHGMVWANGYPAQRLELHDSQTVTFAVQTRVRIRVAIAGAPAESDPDAGSVRAHLRPLDGKGAVATGWISAEPPPSPRRVIVRPEDIPVVFPHRRSLAEKDRAVWTFAVTEPGEYQAHWSLGEWLTGEPQEAAFGHRPVTVRELGSDTEITLTIPVAELRAARAQRER